MSDRDANPLRGKWRITETSQWDADYLDLVEPAFILFGAPGTSEFRFGCVAASLDCAWSRTDVGFEFEGSDEGMDRDGRRRDHVQGSPLAMTGGPPVAIAAELRRRFGAAA